MSYKVEIALDDCTTAWPTKFLPEWSEKTVAFRVKLANLASFSVIAIPNPLAQVMICGLMGEQVDKWPEERDLTSAEQSVGELFVGTIVTSMIESWLSDDRLNLRMIEPEPNLRRTKIFKIKEPVVACRSTLTTPVGAGPWTWILPHEFLTHLFGAVRKDDAATKASTRQQLEALAREMTSQITVRLGGVQLSAPQVAALRVGDLVVLNQKTTDPLRATVSGRLKYFGFPGRVGNRQAFEIAAEGTRFERTSNSTKQDTTTTLH
jgi:flagellar motor switch protein FliM